MLLFVLLALVILCFVAANHYYQHFQIEWRCSNKTKTPPTPLNTGNNMDQSQLYRLNAAQKRPRVRCCCRLASADGEQFDFFPLAFFFYVLYLIFIAILIAVLGISQSHALPTGTNAGAAIDELNSVQTTSADVVIIMDFILIYTVMILSLYESLFSWYRYYTTLMSTRRMEEVSSWTVLKRFSGFALIFCVLFAIQMHVWYWTCTLILVVFVTFNAYCTLQFGWMLIERFELFLKLDDCQLTANQEVLNSVYFMKNTSLVCCGLQTIYLSIFLITYNVKSVYYLPVLWSISCLLFSLNFVRNRRFIQRKFLQMQQKCNIRCSCCKMLKVRVEQQQQKKQAKSDPSTFSRQNGVNQDHAPNAIPTLIAQISKQKRSLQNKPSRSNDSKRKHPNSNLNDLREVLTVPGTPLEAKEPDAENEQDADELDNVYDVIPPQQSLAISVSENIHQRRRQQQASHLYPPSIYDTEAPKSRALLDVRSNPVLTQPAAARTTLTLTLNGKTSSHSASSQSKSRSATHSITVSASDYVAAPSNKPHSKALELLGVYGGHGARPGLQEGSLTAKASNSRSKQRPKVAQKPPSMHLAPTSPDHKRLSKVLNPRSERWKRPHSAVDLQHMIEDNKITTPPSPSHSATRDIPDEKMVQIDLAAPTVTRGGDHETPQRLGPNGEIQRLGRPSVHMVSNSMPVVDQEILKEVQMEDAMQSIHILAKYGFMNRQSINSVRQLNQHQHRRAFPKPKLSTIESNNSRMIEKFHSAQ